MSDVIKRPPMPILYEQACKDLSACRTIDEAIYFDNQADALAAWAKIYKHDQAGKESRLLKLHAYRRMGMIAEELRPSGRLSKDRGKKIGGKRGALHLPGARSLLLENGLTKDQAAAASRLAKLTRSGFEKLSALKRPPSPVAATSRLMRGGSASWKHWSGDINSMQRARYFTRKYEPRQLAAGMTIDEAKMARETATELADWLDEFERHLPKETR